MIVRARREAGGPLWAKRTPRLLILLVVVVVVVVLLCSLLLKEGARRTLVVLREGLAHGQLPWVRFAQLFRFRVSNPRAVAIRSLRNALWKLNSPRFWAHFPQIEPSKTSRRGEVWSAQGPPERSLVLEIGWHYLSNATCPMRPRSFYAPFVVSKVIISHTCHNLPPSEIDLGLLLAVFAGSGEKYLFHRIGWKGRIWQLCKLPHYSPLLKKPALDK